MENEDSKVETSIFLQIRNYENKIDLYEKIDLVFSKEITDLNNSR